MQTSREECAMTLRAWKKARREKRVEEYSELMRDGRSLTPSIMLDGIRD